MSLTLSKVAEMLIVDGRASANDGNILTRFVQEGASSRSELDAAMQLIEESDLPDESKRTALRQIASYMSESAAGLESSIAGLDVDTGQRLARRGVRTSEDLLFVGSNASRRYAFANEVGMPEKELRALVKQADLQRVDGLSPQLAKAMLAVGVDSVVELATRNARSLTEKIEEFSKTTEAWVMKFVPPSEDVVAGFKAAAAQLPRAVEFGRPEADLASMSISSRVDLMIEEDNLLTDNWNEYDSVGDFFAGEGASAAVKDAYKKEHLYVMEEISSRLSYYDIDVSAEDLISGNHSYDEDESGFYFGVEPGVTTFRGPNGELVGAKFDWGTDDGSEGEYWYSIYDAIAGRFTAMYYTESANGETELDVYEDESPDVDVTSLKAGGADLAEAWGDEAIMDGIATIKADKEQYASSPGSFAKSLLKKHFEDDSDHDWQGWVGYGDEFPFTPSALDLAATDINDKGFMYADHSEVARIRSELAAVVAQLGPAEKVQYSTSSGQAVVEGVNNGEPVDTVLHVFLNSDNGAYVSVIARKGSY